MTKRQGESGTIDVKALVAEDEKFLRVLVRTALQECSGGTPYPHLSPRRSTCGSSASMAAAAQ